MMLVSRNIMFVRIFGGVP